MPSKSPAPPSRVHETERVEHDRLVRKPRNTKSHLSHCCGAELIWDATVWQDGCFPVCDVCKERVRKASDTGKINPQYFWWVKGFTPEEEYLFYAEYGYPDKKPDE